MGRARKHTGRPNVLGSDGTHVREVPTYGANRKGCEIGHVASAAGLWSSFTWCSSYPHEIIPGRLMGTRGHRRDLQSDLRDFISELQVYFYCLDAWEGTQILGGARCSSIVEWPVKPLPEILRYPWTL